MPYGPLWKVIAGMPLLPQCNGEICGIITCPLLLLKTVF